MPRKRRSIMLSARGGTWTDYSLRLRARAFREYGSAFLSVALKTGPPPVRAFLLGQALELLLKAFYLSMNLRTTEEELRRRFGHNLVRLLEECEAAGIGKLAHVSRSTREDLSVLNAAYKSKALQYFPLLYLLTPLQIPDLRRLVKLGRALDDALQQAIRAT